MKHTTQPSLRLFKRFLLVAWIMIETQSIFFVTSFTIIPNHLSSLVSLSSGRNACVSNHYKCQSATKVYASKSRKNGNTPKRQKQPQSQPPRAEFEYQELRAQLTTMLNKKIRPKMLATEKRNELESYMMKVLLNRPSPVQLKSLADNNAQALYGKWTLVFSSATATLGDLPREATIELILKEEYRCEYKLSFEKTLGLKSITAKSSYTVDASPVNPGLVTFVYQDIVTDVFGFKNFPVGTFGLLQGRANYVESVWFDGLVWIERGYNPEGLEFFNVYMKEEEED
jgi:hypothetical protein